MQVETQTLLPHFALDSISEGKKQQPTAAAATAEANIQKREKVHESMGKTRA